MIKNQPHIKIFSVVILTAYLAFLGASALHYHIININSGNSKLYSISEDNNFADAHDDADCALFHSTSNRYTLVLDYNGCCRIDNTVSIIPLTGFVKISHNNFSFLQLRGPPRVS